MDEWELDSFDYRILNALGGDGRISITDLAHSIGLSKSPTNARLKRLERAGIITGYTAQFDAIRLGRDHVAFVEVRLNDTRELSLNAFNAAVLAIVEIEQAHLIAGSFDYLLKVRTQSMAAYRAVLAEKISTLPYVASTSTYVAMETVKEGALGDMI